MKVCIQGKEKNRNWTDIIAYCERRLTLASIGPSW
jgi:hypothetical protein